MDLSLESALSGGDSNADQPGRIAGRAMEEWNAAYTKVESYFHALRIRNKVLLGRLVIQVLKRAMRRATLEPQRPTTELAAEELDLVVTEWFGQVLQELSPCIVADKSKVIPEHQMRHIKYQQEKHRPHYIALYGQ